MFTFTIAAANIMQPLLLGGIRAGNNFKKGQG
jgi:hypothetical protein